MCELTESHFFLYQDKEATRPKEILGAEAQERLTALQLRKCSAPQGYNAQIMYAQGAFSWELQRFPPWADATNSTGL